MIPRETGELAGAFQAQGFGALGRRQVVGAVQPNREFVAAEPAQQVGGTERGAQQQGQSA